jgi:hypothetical protein
MMIFSVGSISSPALSTIPLSIASLFLLFFASTTHALASLDDVFAVKPGIGKGGCDDWRTGEENHNLDRYWSDAQELIVAASSSFQLYAVDHHVQMVAYVFFGIFPNPDFTGPATPQDEAVLDNVKSKCGPIAHIIVTDRRSEWFADMERMATAVQWPNGKVALFCGEDWLEPGQPSGAR